MKKPHAALLVSLAFSTPVWAANQTVTLNVPGMTCAACPVTVKHALGKVPGVSKVDVSYEQKQAVVTFDDSKTNIKTLVTATTDAGYPSQPKGAAQ